MQPILVVGIAVMLSFNLAPAMAEPGQGEGPATPRVPDDDNTFDNATLATSGQSRSDNLSSTDDVMDFYKVVASGAGQVFNVSVYVPSYPSVKVRLLAYDPAGVGLDESSIASPWQSLSILAVKSNANYYFSVSIISGNSGDYVLNYALETPAGILPGNSAQDLYLARASDNPCDWYSFQLTAGPVTNQVAEFTIAKSAEVTLDVTIYALWTELMAYTYNISLDTASGGKLSAGATYSGAYYLRVWARSGNGTYTVSLGPLQSVASDNDHDGDHAHKLNNTAVDDRVDQAFDHYDFYRTYLVVNDILDVTMNLNNYTRGKYVLWLYHIVGGLYTPAANASNFVPGTGWTNRVHLVHTGTVNNIYYIIPMAEHGLDAQDRIDSTPAIADYTLKMVSPSGNHAPVLVGNPGYPVMNENAQLTPFNLNELFLEVDGDMMTFNVTGGQHITARLDVDGSVTLIPAKNWAGIEVIVLKATDQYSASTVVNVTVQVSNVNQPPFAANRIQNISLQEDFTLELNITGAFDDPDIPYNDELSYSWIGNTNIPMSLDNTTLVFTLGPVHGWLGVNTITLWARDKLKATAYQKFTITVVHTNHPPHLKGPAQLYVQVNEDAVNDSLSARDYFYDNDTFYALDILRYRGMDSEHINCTVNSADSRTAMRPAPDWNGEETVQVLAIDTGNLSASIDIRVTVLPVNDPPFIVSFQPNASEVGVNETENQTFSIEARDIDTSPGLLTYAWYIDGIKRDDATGPSFTFTTDKDSSRQLPYLLRAEVSDGQYNASYSWTVPVYNKNQPAAITIKSPNEGDRFPEGSLVKLFADAADPEHLPVNYTWMEGNSTLGSLRTMSWKFPPGGHTISVYVWDKYDTSVANVTIFIDSLPTIRIFSPEDRSSYKETDTVKFSAEVFDRDGEPVTFEWRDGSTVLSREGNFTMKLGAGTHYIRINATDGRNFNQTVEMIIKVEASGKGGFLPGFEALTATGSLAVALAALGIIWRRRRGQKK